MLRFLRSACFFLALFACLSLASHPCQQEACGGSSHCHLCQTSTIPAEISIDPAAPDFRMEEALTPGEVAGHKPGAFFIDLTRGPPAA